MSEHELVEDDIWEYKSIRRQKSADKDATGNFREEFVPSGKKTKDGECTSKKSSNRKSKRTLGNKKKSEKCELRPKCSVNKQENNLLSPSQESVTSSEKQNGSDGKKRTPQNMRSVYEGYCPSCQMPFSLLLVQTPRWHVSECLDTPGCTDKECPVGLQCNSTIPSHYKRYTHFLLARNRSGNDYAESQMSSPDRGTVCSDAAKSRCFTTFKDKTLGNMKQTEIRNILGEDLHLPIKASSEKGELSEIHPKVGPRSTRWQGQTLTQSTLQFMQSVDTKTHFDLSGSQESRTCGEAENPDASGQFHVQPPVPDDSNNLEISYSPLGSDDESRKVRHSRKRLFPPENSEEEQSDVEMDCFIVLNKLNEIPNDKGYGHLNPGRGSFTAFAEHCDEGSDLDNSKTFTDKFSQNDAVGTSSSTGYAASLLSQHLDAESPFSLDPEKIKEEPDWPEFSSPVPGTSQSNSKDSDASGWLSSTLVSSKMVLSVKAEDEEEVLSYSIQSDIVKQQKVKDDVFSGSPSGKLFDCVSGFTSSPSHFAEQANPLFQTALLNCQNVPLKRLSSAPVTNASIQGLSRKRFKQMDIGVFFGLKPKAKEEEKNLALQKHNSSPEATSNVKRPRQKKRKAEGSVGEGTETATGACNTGGVPREVTNGGHCGWKKRFKESSTTEKRERQCPFYKKIPGTGFVVDAFQYGEIEGCTAYFLTHFHCDHYGGLTKKFSFPIYCSKITGNLVRGKLHVQEQYINSLPMNTECMVNGVKVILLEANHCPGAVLFLFCLPNGTTVLHTGDFRAHPCMERYPALIGRKINLLYLDTTYCSPEYTFPSQQEAIQFAVSIAFEIVTLQPRTLVVCGTYSVGKEKVFLAIAEVLGCKVSMSQDKYKTLQCLESDEVQSLITTDWNSTCLHVLPMMHINFKGLLNHLNKFSKYDSVLAFKPTGWTYSDRFNSVADIRPEIRGNITIYGIPYSEHSSYSEMKRFVQWLRPQKIIPTVNVGSWKSRGVMEKYFREWLAEPAHSC